MRATSLKGKHVEALLQRWQAEGLSAGTLKNRMAHLRWWAEKIGKAGVIPTDNAQLGISERRFVADENKARELGNDVDRIRDPYVRMSLALQRASGCGAKKRSNSSPVTPIAAIASCSRARGPRAAVLEQCRSPRRNSGRHSTPRTAWQAAARSSRRRRPTFSSARLTTGSARRRA